jgi:excisionase family DNA binding protein
MTGKLSELPNSVAEPDLISIPEAADVLGLHKDTLYKLARTGRFPPAVAIGGRFRVSVPRLRRYLHARRHEGATWP